MTMIRRLATIVLLGALAACSSPDSPAPTAAASPNVELSARAGFGGKDAVPFTAVDEATFQTPSKNIFCHLTAESVRCDIARKTWRPPPKPADCELDWGNGLYVDEAAAGLTCTGDTLRGAATETLAYGRGLRAGSIRCESADSALTCQNVDSGHGFTLAAAHYTTF
jgi:hypothetical protein